MHNLQMTMGRGTHRQIRYSNIQSTLGFQRLCSKFQSVNSNIVGKCCARISLPISKLQIISRPIQLYPLFKTKTVNKIRRTHDCTFSNHCKKSDLLKIFLYLKKLHILLRSRFNLMLLHKPFFVNNGLCIVMIESK